MLWRKGVHGVELLLVHPGGPYWQGKNEHGWSIPKGEFDPVTEDPETCARREFHEELGSPLPADEPMTALAIVKTSGKHIYPFLLQGDFEPTSLRSNTTEIEWPPRSGKRITIPEVDAAAWIPLAEAQRFLHKGQAKIPVLVLAELEK